MAKIGRSARGEIVNFDLLAIRQQLANAPVPIQVTARREYIDNKEAGKPQVEKPALDPLLQPIKAGSDLEDAAELE